MSGEDSSVLLQEYETSISIPIKKSIFDAICSDFKIENVYMILYFDNGIRMSDSKIQSKIINSRKNLIKIISYDDLMYFIPYSRTDSLECPSAAPESLEVRTYIYRRIIYKEKICEKFDTRISIEERVNSDGIVYYLTAEVEYDQLSYTYYNMNCNVENIFFDLFSSHCMYYIHTLKTTDLFTYSPMNIMNYGSRVFRSLHKNCTASPRDKVVFKFDGYKCKIGIQDGQITYYDAQHNFSSGFCPELDKYENIVFQGEVMADVLYLVDILGGFVNNGKDLYMPQPSDVFDFFEWFRNDLKKCGKTEPFDLILTNQQQQIKTYKVYTQYLVTGGLSEKCEFPYDGYIVVDNGNLIKYKIPTIDVKVDNGYLKLMDRALPIADKLYDHLKNNAIYEVQQNTNGEYVILKLRLDRIVPSSAAEYEEYIKELNFMRTAIRASKSDVLTKKLQKCKQ
ncbi:LEF-4 [Homarus gammarus nudivirus]|uniref:LEF-4 n=1 Tax=Homarus gammarus nudivirus TaxID=2509616 RepID=A0A411HBC1_9VIRU|nr:LEF-4 [Homarus gammarus nudivirus]QBB28686.1 LEF-4 [Homarus gammarus nudivirus]